MTSDTKIDYEVLSQEAMRGLVRTVLQRIAKSGLPGEHHFYISFDTNAPGVSISKRLREKYPNEMTIVLQHRFWDLSVSDERFEVKLTFDGIPERVVVPFPAIKVFFDPSVRYGLQFEDPEFNADAVDLSVSSLDHNFTEPDHIPMPGQYPSEPATISHLARRNGELVEDHQSESGHRGTAAEEPATVTNEPVDEADVEHAGAEIVSLDAFRKK
ncbi:MAG: hypothetical protein KJ622_09855 [Alphaproteobacteria bacterium]|nr:hypothetical protein [Alphaproteobacteria bacterium]